MSTADEVVGIIGASTLVGECALKALSERRVTAIAFSRTGSPAHWRNPLDEGAFDDIASCICLAPIWVLPAYFEAMRRAGVKRVVAVSSTSRFTKDASEDDGERDVARKLIQAEQALISWANEHAVAYVILRPTLIYGKGRDKNISEIARFILRFGFFPLLGGGNGLRQPIHAEDVAYACLAALDHDVASGACNIPGGETLSYHEMVRRIFVALGLKPRMIKMPLWCFETALYLVRLVPRYRKLSLSMVRRMNRDLAFSAEDAAKLIAFSPRKFIMSKADLPDRES